MGLLSLLLRNPLGFFILVPALLYSVIIHEVSHGWVASWFGDNTARYSGRLSLNPRDHLDPIGTLCLFLFGFGWAKPVPVNYNNLTPQRQGILCVALAGCVSNIIIATISLFILKVFLAYSTHSYLGIFLLTLARINIILGAFNLIPLPPLDGSKILFSFLSFKGQMLFARIEPYGFFILIFLLYTGMLEPIINIVQSVILGFINLILTLA